MRDKIAHALCNFILNHIATKWYRDSIERRIAAGMEVVGWNDLRFMSDDAAQSMIQSRAAFYDMVRKIEWSNLCPACKGYEDQEHTKDDNCIALPNEL